MFDYGISGMKGVIGGQKIDRRRLAPKRLARFERGTRESSGKRITAVGIRSLIAVGMIAVMAVVATRAFLVKRVQYVSTLLDSLTFDHRIGALSSVISCAALLVVGRLYALQGSEFSKWRGIAEKQHKASVRVQGARGTVIDAMGRSLAVSVKAVSVGVHPSEVTDAPRVVDALSRILGRSAEEIKAKLAEKKPFVWLARGLPVSLAAELKPLKLDGVSMVQEFRRYYPQGGIAGPVLGRVSRDGDGLSGVERQFESVLKADDMRLPMRRDARGRLLNVTAPLGAGEVTGGLLREGSKNASGREALIRAAHDLSPVVREEGGVVAISLDSVVQGIVEEEFNRGEKESQAKRVFGMVMDAESGEVLSIAQSSSFNPNRFDKVDPVELRSAVLQDSFEPGSTLKPIVAALALDAGKVSATENINCENGRYQIGKHTIRDVHPSGVLSFGDVLVRSSNICMAKMGMRMGRSGLYAALRDFGFGAATDIELQGEAKGILRNVAQWSEIDQATHSFGQGISVTTLQLVQAYAALANGGLLVHPTLRKPNPNGRREARRVLSSASAKTVAEILTGVTEGEHGTGKNAAIAGVKVHGKTGTAQKARENGRGYDPDKILASFVGFVNAEEIGLSRKLVMLVAVDEPGVMPRWGGAVAAPVFKRAMSRILTHLLTTGSQDRGVQDRQNRDDTDGDTAHGELEEQRIANALGKSSRLS